MTAANQEIRVHYNDDVLRSTRFFVRTNEHIFDLPWWTTLFHQCKSLIEHRDKHPNHVVDARALTEKIAAEFAETGREFAVIDMPRLGIFTASKSAVSAALAGNTWALFHEVCAWIGSKAGWKNAWFVGDDLKPNWHGNGPHQLDPDLTEETST